MFPIVPPLNLEMQGDVIANLQKALGIILRKSFIQNKTGLSEKEKNTFKEEVKAQYYGETTGKLVQLVQKKNHLAVSGIVDDRTAVRLNEILTQMNVFNDPPPRRA